MRISFSDILKDADSALAVFVTKGNKLSPSAAALDKKTGNAIKRAVRNSNFKGNRGQTLDIVGPAERASHYPRELSGGQEQRVAIARAIVSDPKLLLCDEPTGDLDRETADEILRLLQVLNRDHGKTIVMVTHDAQAAEYANRTLHCDKGTLEAREAA